MSRARHVHHYHPHRHLHPQCRYSATSSIPFRGALSDVLAQTVSYPFEVVRRRMQVGGLNQPGRWLRWGETVHAIWMRGGARGFFVGLSIRYLKIVRDERGELFCLAERKKRLLGLRRNKLHIANSFRIVN